jgi:hypothetical protein
MSNRAAYPLDWVGSAEDPSETKAYLDVATIGHRGFIA